MEEVVEKKRYYALHSSIFRFDEHLHFFLS